MGRPKVLLLSGSDEITRLLAALLEISADEVRTFTDGAEAFQRMWDDDYDVIITELGLPGIDGRDLYMALQNTWPELTRRMIFVCATPDDSIRDFASRMGVPLVRVPSAAEELELALRSVAASNPFA
jgi:DNA-binding response OmpR family regulator